MTSDIITSKDLKKMDPVFGQNSFDGLSPGEYVGIRQNVRCQYITILHVGHVRLEPFVSLCGSGARHDVH